MQEIDYRYNENELIKQIKEYVDLTYTQHYSRNRFQASEFIIDNGHGIGFTIGNVMKYAQRYGVKGKPEDWRKDLMKVIHYAIMALYTHDLDHNPVKSEGSLSPNDGIIKATVYDGFGKETEIKFHKQYPFNNDGIISVGKELLDLGSPTVSPQLLNENDGVISGGV